MSDFSEKVIYLQKIKIYTQGVQINKVTNHRNITILYIWEKESYCLSKYNPLDVMYFWQCSYKCWKLLQQSSFTWPWISEIIALCPFNLAIKSLQSRKSLAVKNQEYGGQDTSAIECWMRIRFTHITVWNWSLSHAATYDEYVPKDMSFWYKFFID